MTAEGTVSENAKHLRTAKKILRRGAGAARRRERHGKEAPHPRGKNAAGTSGTFLEKQKKTRKAISFRPFGRLSCFSRSGATAPLRFGADYGARTRHLDLGKVALYQMS